MSEFDYSSFGVASQGVDVYGSQGADMSGLIMAQLAGGLIISIGHMIIPYILMAVGQYMLGQKLGTKNNWQAWVPIVNTYHFRRIAQVNVIYLISLYVAPILFIAVPLIRLLGQLMQVSPTIMHASNMTIGGLLLPFTVMFFVSLARISYKIIKRLGYNPWLTLLLFFFTPITILILGIVYKPVRNVPQSHIPPTV